MPIEPVKIPQNVYIEDRLFGPITLRQVLITGIGGGISYILWATAQNIVEKNAGGVPATVSLPVTIICWIPAVIAAIFAFVKINDLSMFRIVLLSLEKFNKPATRTWSPRQGIHVHIRTFREEKEEKPKKQASDAKLQKLDDIRDALDAPLNQETNFAIAATQQTEQTDPLERTLNLASAVQGTRIPVNREKISATPMDAATSVDGIAPSKAAPAEPAQDSTSIFRDLSPRTTHG